MGGGTEDCQLRIRYYRTRTYPVFWHTLLPFQPREVAWLSRDAKERLEVVSIQVTRWNISTMVAHEVDLIETSVQPDSCAIVDFTYDEVVRSWYDYDCRKGSSEIVWVVGNGLILGFLELGSELVQSVSV